MSHSDSEENPSTSPALARWRWALRATIRTLPNVPFFLGIVLGFVGCAVAGRVLSQQMKFKQFVRFFEPIQPQQLFYPTASQLASHVRRTVPAGKTPVLIGGASYFRGTGQNQSELWSRELQRLLGDRHVVINFAIDRAEITSFAAVVFAMLAPEYPDLLYVANGSTLAGAAWDGGEDYNYLFWDAYYKGLLPPSLAAAPRIQQLGRDQRRNATGLELHLGRWLDSVSYSCELWTHLAYHDFTVWTPGQAAAPFRPRKLPREGDIPNWAEHQRNARADAEYARHSERSAHEGARVGFKPGVDGKPQPDTKFWDRMASEWQLLFPDELKSRCFVVLLRGNPHFMQTLTAAEREQTEQQYTLGEQLLERLGYRAVQLRASDFTADDYLDGGHLMPSGGNKVAQAVAARIAQSHLTSPPATRPAP